jgi:hypothetical protein
MIEKTFAGLTFFGNVRGVNTKNVCGNNMENVRGVNILEENIYLEKNILLEIKKNLRQNKKILIRMVVTKTVIRQNFATISRFYQKAKLRCGISKHIIYKFYQQKIKETK